MLKNIEQRLKIQIEHKEQNNPKPTKSIEPIVHDDLEMAKKEFRNLQPVFNTTRRCLFSLTLYDKSNESINLSAKKLYTNIDNEFKSICSAKNTIPREEKITKIKSLTKNLKHSTNAMWNYNKKDGLQKYANYVKREKPKVKDVIHRSMQELGYHLFALFSKKAAKKKFGEHTFFGVAKDVLSPNKTKKEMRKFHQNLRRAKA